MKTLHEIATEYAEKNFPISRNDVVKHDVAFHSFCDGFNEAMTTQTERIWNDAVRITKRKAANAFCKTCTLYKEHTCTIREDCGSRKEFKQLLDKE